MNEHTESGIFRQGIGLLCIVGGLSALAGLYFIDVPAGNKEPLLLAIGIILGLGRLGRQFGIRRDNHGPEGCRDGCPHDGAATTGKRSSGTG
jgi:hypothetical protein